MRLNASYPILFSFNIKYCGVVIVVIDYLYGYGKRLLVFYVGICYVAKVV